MRQQSIFTIGPAAIEAGVPEAYLGCPFILTPEGYPEHINRHLQDLWAGKWYHSLTTADQSASAGPAGHGGTRVPRMRYRPLPSTMREAANRLLNLLQWCADSRMHCGRRCLDPLRLTEADVDRYGQQMEAGQWSADGKPLSGSTIGQRQLAAICFLHWAKARGLAATEFKAAEQRASRVILSGRRCVLTRRQYAVVRRAPPARIRLPTFTEVTQAINAIPDVALQIGTKLVFFCGLRASEVCAIKVEDALDTGNQRIGEQHFLRVLGKGRKWRNVEIGASLLQEIQDYVAFERPIRLHRHRQRSPVLLINDKTGRPFIYRTFWKAFTATGAISPHLGRHWYAVHYLLHSWQREQAKAAKRGLLLSTDVMPKVLSVDLLRLQQNMGHTWFATTERYLVTLSQYVNTTDVAMQYQNSFDGTH